MVQNLEDNNSTLPSGSYCFQIVNGKVVGYSDSISEDTDGVKFSVAEVDDPVIYLGRSEQDLGRSITPKALVEQNTTEKLRAAAKNAYIDLQFAIDMEDPDVETKRSIYNNAVANYKASL